MKKANEIFFLFIYIQFIKMIMIFLHWHLLRSGKSACKEIHARRLPNSTFCGSVVMSAMFTFCTRWTVYHWRMSILDKRYQDIRQHYKTGNGMVCWRSRWRVTLNRLAVEKKVVGRARPFVEMFAVMFSVGQYWTLTMLVLTPSLT